MAEAQNDHPSLPSRGKVQQVRKQWAVHEDGALAYQIQNEEINEHYGLNRFHRQMVREDIPVAKYVQSEEELRLQQERMKQLELLNAQAEEDAKIAKKISRHVKQEVQNHDDDEELDDEELARQLQEKEKRKYERHIERKKERKLKKERQILEATLAKESEEARLAHNSENSSHVSASVESLNLQGVSVTRVTPSGHIEDNGDFSDFYNLPNEMDEFSRLEIQASQDEELARLLQEQEHKRTKANIDQEKLRKIELQDEQLARIIEEQEKLRLKKARQKHQARKEARRQLSSESMPLGASANLMNQQKSLQQIPSSSVSTAVSVNSSGHQRYRSNSYSQACDSPPSPPRSPLPQHSRSNRGHQQTSPSPDQRIDTSSSYNHDNQRYTKTQQIMAQTPSSSPPQHSRSDRTNRGHRQPSPSLDQRTDTSGNHDRGSQLYMKTQQVTAQTPSSPLLQHPRSGRGDRHHRQMSPPPDQTADTSSGYSHDSQRFIKHQQVVEYPSSSSSATSSPRPENSGPRRGLSTLESARQIAAGNPDGILAIQTSQKAVDLHKGRSLQDHTVISHYGPNTDIIQAQGNVSRSTRKLSDPQRPGAHSQTEPVVYSQPYRPHLDYTGAELRQSSDDDEVRNLMADRGGNSSADLSSHPRATQHPQQPSRSGLHIKKDDSPHHHDPYPGGLTGFNIAAAIDPTYQRRQKSEAGLMQETQHRQDIAYTLPQADGDLEWDPNLRGSLRKTKTQLRGYQGTTAADHGDALVGEQVSLPWQPVQGQRRRDPNSRNKLGNDGKGNCKQQ